MPSRVYDQLDLIGVSEGYTTGPSLTNCIINLNNPSYGEFDFLVTGNDGPVTNATLQYTYAYGKNATVDFSIFPHIPDGSLITRALVTATFSVSTTLNAAHVAGGGGFTNDVNIVDQFPNSGDIPNHVTSTSGAAGATSSFNAANTPVFDFVFDPPLALTDFIASYASFLPTISTQSENGHASSGNSGGATGQVTATHAWSISDWKLEVFYDEAIRRFNMDTESPIAVGQDIVISTDDKTIDLRKITTIEIDYTTLDNVDHVVTLTDFNADQFVLTFPMIDFGNAPKVTIKLTGTQFSGSVTLGDLLTINFLDGTGIYKLDLTATHDTFYIQDYTPVQTVNMKIPNPLIKTAYVP